MSTLERERGVMAHGEQEAGLGERTARSAVHIPSGAGAARQSGEGSSPSAGVTTQKYHRPDYGQGGPRYRCQTPDPTPEDI